MEMVRSIRFHLYNKDLKNEFKPNKLTIATNNNAEMDFVNSCITYNTKRYSFPPIGMAAQELVVAGGLEDWIKLNL